MATFTVKIAVARRILLLRAGNQALHLRPTNNQITPIKYPMK